MNIGKLLVLFFVLVTTGYSKSATEDAVQLVAFHYDVIPDITYRVVGSWTGKLDLYIPLERQPGTPLLVWIHGGGWTRSSKEEEVLYILPYLTAHWAVANIEYRRASTAQAPAAVEDCQCALSWLAANSGRYTLDTNTVIVSGISAGGHLALTSAGFSKLIADECRLPSKFKVTAIVNWFGPSNVSELAFGPKPFEQAVTWIGSQSNAVQLAQDLSPINFVKTGLPPVITIHGTKDEIVPFSQSVKLHDAMLHSKLPNELVPIKDANHGDFSSEQIFLSYQRIFQFLEKYAKAGSYQSGNKSLRPAPLQ